MLFAAAAVLSSVLSLENGGLALAPEAAAQPWELASALLGQFGTRMAAVSRRRSPRPVSASAACPGR
jgi:hypothetical protein